jgi:hypothetical protein
MTDETKTEFFKKGDIVSVTYRDGYDKNDKPVIKTLERAEVLGREGDYLKIGYRQVPNNWTDGVDYIELDFNMSSADVIMSRCLL